ncbi:MAG: redoxin domain-containing protein [Gemmatimonadetes bacterium]|nr:redoxin domain-containing protein [Gemmatimonadota bacterium]
MNPAIRPRRGALPFALLVLLLLAAVPAGAQTLGPADGRDLPATDLERVSVGEEAPLFTLESYDRGPVELASFRGDKNVVLVFYRGHW